jgi:YjbE family integral membrane protein
MAVRALPPRQRRVASSLGALAAVALRIVITIVAARLLGIEFLKMAGGATILWIAVKLLADSDAPPEAIPARGQLLNAIWLIVVADITMSIDNVLAIAGAARGNSGLIVFGLCLSIPFVVFASNLIATLMDRFRVIVYLGGAILGKVGAEMVMTDPFVSRTLHPSDALTWLVEALAALGILAAGRLLRQRRIPPQPTAGT